MVVHQQPQPVVSQYSPAGVVSIVNEQSGVTGTVSNKPAAGSIRNEQYGQPESAAIPANYKPFGSWGLYIGGNPADGYYTNYYKSLSSSVEKQQVGGSDKPLRSLNPLLKQSGASPYQGADYYPFSYSAADFSANSVLAPHPLSYSPVEASGPSSYIPEMYATKRIGGSKGSSDLQPPIQQQESQSTKSTVKGTQQPTYYSAGAIQPISAVAHQQQQQQPNQVVAYPVPVGSQIVGSQVGVDGAFYPYGVHAFTKYAIKPTVVDSSAAPISYQQPTAYHSNAYNPSHFASIQSSYKYGPIQSPVHLVAGTGASHYSNQQGYYAYPASQLYYSNGAVVPAAVQNHNYDNYHQYGPVASYNVDEEEASARSGVKSG